MMSLNPAITLNRLADDVTTSLMSIPDNVNKLTTTPEKKADSTPASAQNNTISARSKKIFSPEDLLASNLEKVNSVKPQEKFSLQKPVAFAQLAAKSAYIAYIGSEIISALNQDEETRDDPLTTAGKLVLASELMTVADKILNRSTDILNGVEKILLKDNDYFDAKSGKKSNITEYLAIIHQKFITLLEPSTENAMVVNTALTVINGAYGLIGKAAKPS